ncbi:MAG: hypothetical protein GY729_07950 [Desulfobacteraceae bacterium]|nr:hypothetical protein [Desulfobacteraceae bacterium]
MKQHSTKQDKKMWVISSGGHSDQKSFVINGEMITGPVKEYEISDIALYLINPGGIEINEKITGYEVIYKNPDQNNFKSKLLKLLPKGILKKPEAKKNQTKKVIDPEHYSASSFKDEMLESAFSNISDLLLPFSPVIQQLNNEDESKIENISACCEDPGGHNYPLNLSGSISEKLDFIKANLYQTVKINLKRAYMSNGVFELRGFDFKNYNSNNSHRLIRYFVDNKTHYGILDSKNNVKFKIDIDFQIKFLHMLQQSIESDHKLLGAFHDCMNGDSRPHKLLFSKDLSAKYSDTQLPEIFKNELNTTAIGKKELLDITDTLNRSQRVVSFNTITTNTEGKDHLFTTITVMHDLKQLEPIKNYLPDLYMKIEGNIPSTELGKLYLLDSMSGIHNQK